MRSTRLGDILDVQSGFAFKTEFFSDTKGIPLIRIRDLPNTSTETSYQGEFREEFIVEPGEYLIGMDGNFRCHRWQGPRGLLNQRVCRLRNFEADVEPEYIYHGIQKKLQEIEAHTPFATVKHISARQIQNIELPLPTIDEQRRLVDLLSRAEGIVRLRREAQKKATELLPALFLDMFGDPETNPKGWKKLPVQDVSEVSYGIADKLDTTLSAEEGSRILTISNVLLDGSIDHSVERFCKATSQQISKCSIRRGDLLFNWRNGSEIHIGKTAIWEQDAPVLHVSFLLRLRPAAAQVNSYFLWTMLNLLRRREFFIGASRQQINRKFNASELSALTLPIPPKQAQDDFARKVEHIRSIQTQQSTAMQKAQETFDALLARTFNSGQTSLES